MNVRTRKTNEAVVLSDLTSMLDKQRPYAFDHAAIDSVRDDPSRFATRNAALLLAAGYVREERMHRGAKWLSANGHTPPYGYMDDIHFDVLIAERSERAKLIAALACASCPIADSCISTPEEFVKDVRPARVRRRLRERLRREPLNTHLCSTNLDAARLKKDVA